MFTNGLYGIYASFDSMARKATSSSDPGSLGGSILRATALKSRIVTQQTDLADRQEEVRNQLISRFAKMNAGVGVSKSTLSFLQNQIAAWNKSN
jgi:flagellar hook-associated protein 2